MIDILIYGLAVIGALVIAAVAFFFVFVGWEYRRKKWLSRHEP